MKFNLLVLATSIALVGCSIDSGEETSAPEPKEYESLPDSAEDISSIKADATVDAAKIIAEGEYTLNDIELVADYYMSEMYWANYYLYKDFSIIEQQLLEEEDISMELTELTSSYSGLAGRLRGGKGRNGLPVLEEERKEFEDAVFAIGNLSLPDLPPSELINSPEWLEFTTKWHEAYILFDDLEPKVREFLLERAPSQSDTIQGNLERMIEDNSMRDSMEDYF